MLPLLGTPREKIDTMKQLYTVKNSKLHGKGLFAKCNIRAGTNIVEYVGEKITKAQSDRIAEIQLKKAQKNRERIRNSQLKEKRKTLGKREERSYSVNKI